MDDFQKLKETLRRFAAERGWDKYHTPKNLTTALVVEAGELAEIFQWKTADETLSAEETTHAGEEIADVILYAVRVADKLGVDVAAAIEDKIAKNAAKYPKGGAALRPRGSSRRS